VAKAFVGSNPTPRTRSHCLVPTDIGCPKNSAFKVHCGGSQESPAGSGTVPRVDSSSRKKGSYGVELIGVAVVVSVVAVRVPADVTSGVAVGPGWTIWTACG